MALHIILSLVILVIGCDTTVRAGDDVTALVGEAALLKCPNTEGCGDIHSIRWYKADKKIALLAEAAGIEDTDGDMSDRIEVSLQTPGELTILQVQVDDEDDYRCELTYVQPIDTCPSVRIISLRTLMKPTAVSIFDQVAKNMQAEKSLQGLLECTQTSIECKAFGGRPAPKITWKLGDEELADDVSTVGENSDAVTTSRLQLHVERKHHGMKLTCAASSEALDDPMIAELELDLILLPKDINITGVEHHVVEGSKVTLECRSGGARPAASLVWFNGTDVLPSDQTPNTQEEQSDGTFISLARLWFWTSRYDNGRSFHCESSQLAASPQPTLNASQTLDVHYRPEVSVEPAIVMVNETTDVLLFCKYEANPRNLLSITWLQNDVKLNVSDYPDHYEGGNLEEQSLLIKNSSGEDIGDYFCRVENLVGDSTSQLSVHVNITFKPEVQITMSPENFVVESSRQNVTLGCEVLTGNPSTLLLVNWFLDGELLQQLPECNVTDENGKIKDDMCTGVIPSQLLLENVTKSFHGNYSCQGQNLAGLGPVSSQAGLTVFYEPGPAALIFSPQKVIKGESVELTCSVQDGGRPFADSFQWLRGTQMMTEIQSFNWTIDPVNLETEANFSCGAVNKAGLGTPAIVYIEVFAPPYFITNLTSYTGIVYNASDISLNCRIECSPLCTVSWFKNGLLLDDAASNLYSIVNNPIPPDSRNDYFESLDSTLVFNISNWPNQVLDRIVDNAAYTCGSSDNGVGQIINSTTNLGVEYPPENMTVSNKVVSVTEGQVPEKVICSAKGKPDPSFIWLRLNSSAVQSKSSEDESMSPEDGIAREVLTNGYILVLKRGVQRTDSGDLICEASNKHGTVQVTTYLNVMYKPECTITETEIEEEKVLICTANANPTEVSFEWYVKDSNDTVEEDAVSQKNIQSILKLDQMPSIEASRVFVCVANNSVGISEPCLLTVQGSLPWWRWWSRTALLVAAGIGILLILVILLCLIILCICRRRRAASKSPGGAKEPGIDNPGVYENLPFHGLQQAPNKPIQMIQPRVVRAIAEQNNDKSPESALEKQLRCNPSFTPRILSCPPYSHTLRPLTLSSVGISNTSIDTLVPSTSSRALNNTTSQGVSSLNSSTTTLTSSVPHFSRGLSNLSVDENGLKHHDRHLETLNEDCLTSGDEDQKFHSLDAKKDHIKRNEPQFSSMKVVRKRKLDRCYPGTHQIDYIMIDKRDLINKGQKTIGVKGTSTVRTKDVIYANFPGLFSPAISSPEVGLMTNSLTSECMNVSFQNLTDSIQIYENSPADKTRHIFPNRSDSKTPTPAPRTIKSPPITPEKGIKKTSKDHVYANFALKLEEFEKHKKTDECDVKLKRDLENGYLSDEKSKSAFLPISETPKTLPRKFIKSENMYSNLSEKLLSKKKCHPNFTSLTFPKRTTKSGILSDKIPESPVKEKPAKIKEGKIISSKTPSRNSSFNEPTSQSNQDTVDIELHTINHPDEINCVKKELVKISPSVVDATPKVKPFIINSIPANMPPIHQNAPNQNLVNIHSHNSMRQGTINQIKPASLLRKSNENISYDYSTNASIGKGIPKQQMLIQPAKIPLQIPNLLPKPIPKVHPVQKNVIRRSQSSVSSKGGSEYRQHSASSSSEIHDGSLVRAKIRELNLRQNTNPLEQVTQKLNRTHPQNSNNNRPVQLPLQKHHSFCYFQPIHSVSHTENLNENPTIGPLVYKPNKQKGKHKNGDSLYFDNNKSNHEAEFKDRHGRRMDYPLGIAQSTDFNDDSIDPSHRESLNRLHELLKRDNKSGNCSQKKNPQNTYTMSSLNRHKYVPTEDQAVVGFQKKRLVYADLDLEDHDQKYKDKVNSNKKLFSKDSGDKTKHKDEKVVGVQRKPRTEYATLKFEEIDL